MNNWNPIETQLRSWTPRAPSPKLRARLFESPRPASAKAISAPRQSHPSTWHWLAPAMAMLLVCAFVLGGNISQFHTGSHHSLIATAALNEPSLATYFVSTHHSDNNTWQAPFEWTNGNPSLTSAPPMATTNALMQ